MHGAIDASGATDASSSLAIFTDGSWHGGPAGRFSVEVAELGEDSPSAVAELNDVDVEVAVEVEVEDVELGEAEVELGEGAVPADWARLRSLIFDQTKRRCSSFSRSKPMMPSWLWKPFSHVSPGAKKSSTLTRRSPFVEPPL